MSESSNRFSAFKCHKRPAVHAPSAAVHLAFKQQHTEAAPAHQSDKRAPEISAGGTRTLPSRPVASSTTAPTASNSADAQASVGKSIAATGTAGNNVPFQRAGILRFEGQQDGIRKPRSQISSGSRPRLLKGGPPRTVPEKLGDIPLRLILIGHNPSDHAWQTGHVYSNPSNWLWRILKATGIAPPCIRGPEDDDLMLSRAGVGFVDVGTGHPGTHSNKFTSATFVAWAPIFYSRLANHMQRASASIGCTCGRCGAPPLVAFTGKRQFLELMNAGRGNTRKVTKVAFGRQTVLPAGWPLPESTEVFVCTSTSGAAPMTNEARFAPYQAVADRLCPMPWPRVLQNLCCKGSSD